MKKDGDSGPKGAPEWMVTYSDVMSLLVTFFVMLISFSTSDREKFDKASGSLRGALGVTMPNVSRLAISGMMTDRHLLGGRSSPIGMDFPPECENLAWEVNYFNLRLRNEKAGLGLTMQLLTLSRGVLLRIPSSLIFQQGSARLAPGAQEYVSKLGTALRAVPQQIEIVSHVPPRGAAGRAADAWDLTFKRAAKLAELFERLAGLNPGRMCVGGTGASHPYNLKPSDEDDRLEITLLAEGPGGGRARADH